MQLIRKDGTKRFGEASVSLIKDSSGNPIAFRGVVRNITERKQTEETIRQSEERYRTILDEMEDGYFEVDLAGNFIFINDAGCRLLGYSKEKELLGTSFRGHLHKEDLEIVYNAFGDIYKTGKPERGISYRAIRKDGTIGFAEIAGFPLQNTKGEIIGFRGIGREITERKKMEEALRQSEERYRTILEKMQEGYFEVDLAGNFTFFNDATCRVMGYSKEEMTGMNDRQYTDKENAKILFQAFNEVYRTGNPSKAFDWQIMSKDGTKRSIEISASLKKDSSGNPIGFRGTARDITERKQAESQREAALDALRQSEEKYRTILENIEDGYYEVDLAGNLTFFNNSMCRIWGYPKEELMGMNSRQYTDKENAKILFQSFNEVYKTGKPSKGFDWHIISKDGTKRYIEASVSLLKDSSDKPIGFRGIVRDVTERKLAEEALRQSEEKYRTILENMQEGYFEVDLAGNFTFFNDAAGRVIGYPIEEMMGLNSRQYTDKAEAKKLFQTFNEVYKTGNPSEAFDWQIINKDGTKRFIEVSVSLRKDSSGKPIGFRGIGHDITDRKQAESQREAALEALRQSEEKYRTILENIEDGYYEVDIAGNFTFFNDSMCRILGYPQEELMGMNNRQYADEENAKILFQTFTEVYRTGNTARGSDWQIIRKDGTKRFGEASVSLIKDSSGNPIGFRGITRDVTERKQAESQREAALEALRQSEEKYRTILENIEDGYYEVDLNGDFTFFNDATCLLLGYSKEEMMGMNNRQYTDKENLKILFQAFNEVYRTGEPAKEFAWQIIRKDGTKRFLESSISLIKDSSGNPIGFRGVTHDVTERKQAEEKIQHMATHDSLTGLPNRFMFTQLLNHSLQAAKRYQKQCAVLFMDLDRFKIINDTLGHEAGDLLLQEIASRLKQTLRAVDTIARLGGDEFVILWRK